MFRRVGGATTISGFNVTMTDAFLVTADGNLRQASLRAGNWNSQRGALSVSAFVDEAEAC